MLNDKSLPKAWAKLNDLDNKKFDKTGGTLTGSITVPFIKVNGNSNDNFIINSNDKNIIRAGGNDKNSVVIGNETGAVYLDGINDNSLFFRAGSSKSQRKIYHEGNKPTLTDLGIPNVKNIALNWSWGTSNPTHIWGSQGDSSQSYVYNATQMKNFLGLNLVNNWGATSDINANSTTQYATANMVQQVKNQNVFKNSTSDNDLNLSLEQGMHYFAGTITNGPIAGTKYGKLISYVSDNGIHNNNNNWIWQEYYDTSGNRFWRYKVNNENWNTWRKYWDSSNFNPDNKLNINPSNFGISNTSSATGNGIALYGGASTGKPSYGLMFAGTSTFGNHGSVTGDWATYFTMEGSTNRGWIFKHSDSNIASIASNGDITGARVFNAVWNDYAEYFPKLEGYKTEPGDIIALSLQDNDEYYELATEAHNLVVGVHSDQYGHLIGGEHVPAGVNEEFEVYNNKKYIPVGLVGRLPVKFIGEAKKGIKVVPSNIPGVGRAFNSKLDDYDKVIGYIVENNNEPGIRKVKIKIGK